MKHSFAVGQRVQLNMRGRARMPRVRSHAGTVVKLREHSETIWVLLDGHVTPLALHRRYVEWQRKAKSRAKTSEAQESDNLA
jgi:hypothetical protein